MQGSTDRLQGFLRARGDVQVAENDLHVAAAITARTLRNRARCTLRARLADPVCRSLLRLLPPDRAGPGEDEPPSRV